mgnify:FL=1|jgi:ABC-type anion transport system duplicated permease subunit
MKTSILIGAGLLITASFIVLATEESRKFAQYVADHECVVTETKTERELRMVSRYDVALKMMMTTPTWVTETSRHYECQVDGERGTRFWI